GGLPAMLLVVGIEDLHDGLATERLQQAPGRQRAALQVAQTMLLQFIERRDGEELLGKASQLLQPLGFDVPGKRLLQLSVKLALVGCTEERHGNPISNGT